MSEAGLTVAVVGAGAVGCYYGFLLAKAGHAVTLIGRPALVEAVRTSGLILDSAAGTDVVPVQASTEGSGVAGADLVLVCVKSGDTEAAGAMIAPHLDPASTILSLRTASTTPSAWPRCSGGPSCRWRSMSPPRWPGPAASGTTGGAT